MNFGNNFEFYGSLKTTPFDFEATSILQQSCLNQIIDRSTHFAKTTNGHTASLLDHIWIDRVDLVTKAVVFSPISDHCGTGAVLDLLSPKPKVKTIQKYCFSEMTHQDSPLTTRTLPLRLGWIKNSKILERHQRGTKLKIEPKRIGISHHSKMFGITQKYQARKSSLLRESPQLNIWGFF